jgi:hypothetical protein
MRRPWSLPWLFVLFASASACGGRVPHPETVAVAAGAEVLRAPVAPRRFDGVDSVSSRVVAPGIIEHDLVVMRGPLRAHVLEVDLAQCVSVRAVKGSATAVGRTTTTALLQSLPSGDRAIAAVNADFFVFAPPGVPVNALVVDGQVISGPVKRPVFALGGTQRPFIGTLTTSGAIVSARAQVRLTGWNRPTAAQLGVVDARWGQPLDTLVRPTALRLTPVGPTRTVPRYRIDALPASHDGTARGDTLMLVGRARGALAVGDTVTVTTTLAPFMPTQAVGGFPLLVRDSVIVPTVDTDGAESFRALNPRTAVGYGADGRRLFLVVIDGRQKGYSVGTTIRETAALMRAIGAREAVNLDGGGSTAMVVRDPATGAVRTVNKPSDATGERPVADALVVTGSCAPRP